jgi:thioredoxin-related protein
LLFNKCNGQAHHAAPKPIAISSNALRVAAPNFEKIKEKNKILIAINLQTALELESYPVFMIFDKEGTQVFQYVGYNKEALLPAMQAILLS